MWTFQELIFTFALERKYISWKEMEYDLKPQFRLDRREGKTASKMKCQKNEANWSKGDVSGLELGEEQNK